mmetsp:Transcript_10716/g.20674  ORF Transcript_10716/g.20674 Transcript_10716/m.20674 type:complete len:725 (+) Transcript_10716:282-2456(+)
MTSRSNDIPVESLGSGVASTSNSRRRRDTATTAVAYSVLHNSHNEGGEKLKSKSEIHAKELLSNKLNVDSNINTTNKAVNTNSQTMDRKPPAVATPPKEQPPRSSRRTHRRSTDMNDDAIFPGTRQMGYGGENLMNDMNLSFSPGPTARAAPPVARASTAMAMASNHAARPPPEPPVAWPSNYQPPPYHMAQHAAWTTSFASPSKRQKTLHHSPEHRRTDRAKRGGTNRPGKYQDYSHLDEDDVLENLLFLSSTEKKKRPLVEKKNDAMDCEEKMDSKQSAKKKGNESDGKQLTVDTANNDLPRGLSAFANNNTFPMKLHQILSSDEHSNAVVWLPHGRAWKVVNMDLLEKEFLPKFFNHRRRESFRRQVDCWNFRRIVKGADAGAYYHEKFLRGMPHISLLMTESKKSKRSPSHSKMLDIHPHYYAVSRANPLPEPGRSTPRINRANGRNQYDESIRHVDANQMPYNNNGEDNHPTVVAGDATSPSSSEDDSFSTLQDDNPPDFYANPMPPCIIADAEEKTVESDVTDEEEYERRRAAVMARQWYDQHNHWASSFYNGVTTADLNAFYHLQFGNSNNILPAVGTMAFAPPAPMIPPQYPGYAIPPAPGAYPPMAYMPLFPPSMSMAPAFHPHPPHGYQPFYLPAAAVYAPPPAGYAGYHHHVYHNVYPHADSNAPVSHHRMMMSGGAPHAPYQDVTQSNEEWREMKRKQEADESGDGNGFESG